MKANALIIIAKYPEKENVKTRLRGLLSDRKRINLYRSLLAHTVKVLKDIPDTDTFIAYAPPGSHDYFSSFKTGLIPLSGEDLGAGMYQAFREIFLKRYRKASLVGADIPDISVDIILRSFRVLAGKDVVFGPARDGGYYLIGMKKPIRELFEDIPWSSDRTLKASIKKAERSGYSVGLTEALSDVDTIEDIKNLSLLKNHGDLHMDPE